MNTLTCRFGLAQPVVVPPWLSEGGAERVGAEFHTASGGAIDFDLDTFDIDTPQLATKTPLGSFDLHRALRTLIGPGEQPAETIGVVFASRYKHAPIFGIMFDTAFDLDVPAEGTAPSLAGRPREGCAIFIDEIASRREGGYECDAQSFFTTVHEIGHVFNLHHFNSKPCFMCESPYDYTFDSKYWQFTPAQSLYLGRARPTEPLIWPGGSRFVDLGHANDAAATPTQRRAPVSLCLSLAREHFQYFEPVELDIEVRLAPHRQRAVRIPDTIDPGYEQFKIWIEEPNGVRRLFRSPRHYCWSGGLRSIGLDTSFRRDISIYGESGGFAFRRRGVHQLWAELQLPGGAIVTSNAIAFEIEGVTTSRAVRDEALFSTGPVRTTLYHRVDRHRGHSFRGLRDWLELNRRHPAAPSVRYSMARALLEKSRPPKGISQKALYQEATGWLRSVADAKRVGRHQREIATELLASRVDQAR
jgi:hypothetical protein